MVWDTARTKQLLLDAAVAEFAEHGLEGARVARVATRAGVNKERIYQYFGNKEKLFGAVLESELRKIAAAVPLTADQGADLGDYAGRLFDYHRRHPHFVRLLAWEGLQSRGPVVAEAERTEHYVEKVAALARAQEAGVLAQDIPPGQLVHAVISLVASWFTMPQLARMLVPAAKAGEGAQREALVNLVRRLAA
ncbi:TetR family transcriptional regulator [Streptomyces sp. NBC_01257]|uniref:TetR family transcriptional regulator n=1 Tax=Streptomyces sp. NBC_01257 TaxID=2903799 RepID=UPI002DDB1A51|nr:TetR family transcriptional regulator [Streptomyces sp. NBC_01257]WRZ62496.1 TetR family transcriptional regulator [Streptomyces sp. NBC_01257]